MGNCLSKIVMCMGDDGIIGFGDGWCIGKDDVWIVVIGDVDELNLNFGVLLVEMLLDDVCMVFVMIQYDLFDFGGELCIFGYVVFDDMYFVWFD